MNKNEIFVKIISLRLILHCRQQEYAFFWFNLFTFYFWGSIKCIFYAVKAMLESFFCIFCIFWIWNLLWCVKNSLSGETGSPQTQCISKLKPESFPITLLEMNSFTIIQFIDNLWYLSGWTSVTAKFVLTNLWIFVTS